MGAPPVSAAPSATAADVEQRLLQGLDLAGCELRYGHYASIRFGSVQLAGRDLRGAVFQDADLGGADLRAVEAVRAVFTKARLVRADLRGANLCDAVLLSADLTGADLRGCRLTPDTRLHGATVKGARIDLQSLRMLGPELGGLTQADLAEMEVHDDLATLTRGFGGFWAQLHLLAVTIFLMPYLVFMLRRYVEAQTQPCQTDCAPLREALWHYIVTGGTPGAVDGIGLGIFVLLLIYNGFRASLVFKEGSLRLAASATGQPAVFELKGYWAFAFRACQMLFWLNLVLIAVHAYSFLDTPVHG